MNNELLLRACDLLEMAVGDAAQVAPSPPDQVHVMPRRGERTTLRVIPWQGKGHGTVGRGKTLMFLPRHTKTDLDHLRREGSSFVSLAGAVRLDVPGLFIDRTDLQGLRPVSQIASRNPFSDQASMIARTLFRGPMARRWQLSELARSAGVANSTCSYVIRELAELGLVKFVDIGRPKSVTLVDRLALIEAWSRAYDWRRNLHFSVNAPMGSPLRFMKRLGEHISIHWAATLHVGSDLLMKHALSEKLHIYLDVDTPLGLERYVEETVWEPSSDGRLVLMAPYYRRSLWRTAGSVRGMPVVSELQLILDLWHHPLRGRETAQLLLRRYERGELATVG